MKSVAVFILCIIGLSAQTKSPQIPALLTNGSVTTHSEMLQFLYSVQSVYPALSIDTNTHTVQGRSVPVVRFRNSNNQSLKVLYFAQQHGDEPSGKEGMLQLIKELATGTLKSMLKNLDIVIIPQMNPDGAAVCRRRNGNNMDLNRNHLILTETETSLLHTLYHSFRPDVTVDFHEYSPFSEEWMKYGAIKNTDEQIGTLTNPNIPAGIRNYQNKIVIPFLIKELNSAGFSSSHYLPGGPPEQDRIRYSTVDINDGRQGLGSFGSLSFIIEGKNGKDCNDNITFRAKGQYTAAASLLQFCLKNKTEIKKLTAATKKELMSVKPGAKVHTVIEHTATGEKLNALLRSVETGHDTTVSISLFHPAVTALHSVTVPEGYLIPKSEKDIIALLQKHQVLPEQFSLSKSVLVMAYNISKIDTITVEEDPVLRPEMAKEPVTINPDDYFYFPLKGVNAKYIVQALEPYSFFGIHKNAKYNYLLKPQSVYPLLRVEKAG